MSVYIIAEAGVNHNGSLETAISLINEAKEAGVNCVKFQTFKSEKIVSRTAPKADYQIKNTQNDDSQFEMLKKLELSFEQFEYLKNYCDKIGIDFLSTPFDDDSIAFLDKLGMKFWKIPSGEITNYPYLVRIGKTRKPVVMSTGMSTIDEIKQAIKVLKENGCPNISLLHCNTEYPTPFSDVNLLAMDAMRKELGLDVGYSDHTKGIEVPISAVALGAKIIEKHFTLSRQMVGPDHKASLEPIELKEMVRCIRNIELALGKPVKMVTESEKKNRLIARKSLVAKRPIHKGELFSSDNICSKRPGTGISPMMWNEVIGTAAKRDFSTDELIEV